MFELREQIEELQEEGMEAKKNEDWLKKHRELVLAIDDQVAEIFPQLEVGCFHEFE